MKFRRRGLGGGVPWDHVCCYICCPCACTHTHARVGNRSGHLIKVPAVSGRPLQLLHERGRLCEERLANIDSSWRTDEIKECGGQGELSERGRRRRNNRWEPLSWMIYAIQSSQTSRRWETHQFFFSRAVDGVESWGQDFPIKIRELAWLHISHFVSKLFNFWILKMYLST